MSNDLEGAAERGSEKKANLDDVVEDQEPDPVRLTVDLPPSFHKRLKMQSVQEGRSMKDVTMEALEDYLSDDE